MARKRRGELSTAAFRDEAYRGYLIRQSPINEAIWVEKDGFMIGHAKSKDDARRIIEELTVKTNPRKRAHWNTGDRFQVALDEITTVSGKKYQKGDKGFYRLASDPDQSGFASFDKTPTMYPEAVPYAWVSPARESNPRKRRRNPTTGGNVNVQHFERWNRGGRHKWITKAIAAKLPRIGTTSELPPEKVRVALKLFNPGGAGSWFITEANLDTGEAFGYVTGLGDDELGYMDLNEMRAFKGRFGLPLERDEHFSGTLAEVMDGKKNPRSYPNIEKLSGRDHYTGYADGPWTISKHGTQWLASKNDGRDRFYGVTLAEVSEKLSVRNAKKNPKARDPSHRKLLKRLDTHFAADERAMKKNPGAWVIASTLHNGTALTFDGSNRFTDSRKPNLYRTRVAAQDKLALLRKHFKGNDTLNRAFVREAQGDETGAVFGARPRINPKSRASKKIQDAATFAIEYLSNDRDPGEIVGHLAAKGLTASEIYKAMTFPGVAVSKAAIARAFKENNLPLPKS